MEYYNHLQVINPTTPTEDHKRSYTIPKYQGNYELGYDSGYKNGYADAKKEILDALEINTMPVLLVDFLKGLVKQATGWGLLTEVVDHSVSVHVAANQLRREIEDYRHKKFIS